jgi:predicted GH43/DUF377 family glycosyl hydrolase
MNIIEIPNSSLMGENVRCFNNSIIDYQGRTFMLYRYEPNGDYPTEIAMVELDSSFMPIGQSKKLRLPRLSSKIVTIDDPRLFVHKGEMWFTHCQGALQEGWQWSSTLAVAKLPVNVDVMNVYQPDYGNNINYATHNKPKGSEKNWSPFMHDGKLHMIYMIDPLEIIEYDPLNGVVKEVRCSRKPIPYEYNFGKPFGGTPLIPHRGGYFGIFHSYTVTDPRLANCRTYHMGAFLLKKGIDGFYVEKMSKKPILSAKEEPEKDLRHNRAGWRPNCIYPCGIIERNARIYIAYGWQDCRCNVVELGWDEILNDMEEIDYTKPKEERHDEHKPIRNERTTNHNNSINRLSDDELAERASRFKNARKDLISNT